MKQRRQFIRLILALIGSILPGQIILAQADSKSSITPDMVRPIVVKLSGDDLVGQGAGYPGDKKAAEIIAAEFKPLDFKLAAISSASHRIHFQTTKYLLCTP